MSLQLVQAESSSLDEKCLESRVFRVFFPVFRECLYFSGPINEDVKFIVRYGRTVRLNWSETQFCLKEIKILTSSRKLRGENRGVRG